MISSHVLILRNPIWCRLLRIQLVMIAIQMEKEFLQDLTGTNPSSFEKKTAAVSTPLVSGAGYALCLCTAIMAVLLNTGLIHPELFF